MSGSADGPVRGRAASSAPAASASVQAELDRDEARRVAAADKASDTTGPGAETKRAGSTGPARAVPARAAVRVDRSGPVTTVIIDRPEARNAVDGPTAELLAEAFADFDADADAAVGVLFGDGGTFCAGADLKAVGGPNGNRAQPDGDGPMGPTRMRLSKPVIAAVAGHAVAGGLELALWCDLRIAEEDAVFGVFCRRWGVPLIDGGTVRLPQVVGLGRALDMILTGRAVPAAEAYQMGLVTRVVKRGTARERAEELALEIAALPQACLRSDRASALEATSLSFEDAMAGEFSHGMGVLTDPAIIEGVARFRGGAGRGGSPA